MAKQKRKSAKKKAQLVLELFRGKPIEEVSRENQVTVSDLTAWREIFLKQGEMGLKSFLKTVRSASMNELWDDCRWNLSYIKKKRASGNRCTAIHQKNDWTN